MANNTVFGQIIFETRNSSKSFSFENEFKSLKT